MTGPNLKTFDENPKRSWLAKRNIMPSISETLCLRTPSISGLSSNHPWDSVLVPRIYVMVKPLWQTCSIDKANLLNSFFHSVFTDTTPPTPDNTPTATFIPHLPSIQLAFDGVMKALHSLDPKKASWPDEIPGMILKNTAQACTIVVLTVQLVSILRNSS